jgi:site-specific recombinase XerD
MTVPGKTGTHSYRLKPEMYDALMSIAAPNAQVFTSKLHPEGMTTKALIGKVRGINEKAGIKGEKVGPHTLRYSSASLVSQESNGNLLLIKSIIQDSEDKNAMVYVHDIEDRLKQSVSPWSF